jgi:hypothetical protein
MPTFYFHLRDGVETLLDHHGRKLGDATQVPALALVEARSLIGQEALQGRIDLDQRIEVESPMGTVVHTLNFDDAVEIVGGRR